MALTKTLTENHNCPIFIYQDKNILVQMGTFNLPDITTFNDCVSNSCILDWFYETDYDYIAAKTQKETKAPKGYEFIALRNIFAVQVSYASTAARAAGLLNWATTDKFCCKCGGELRYSTTETAKICKSCSYIEYPRLMPAIIVLIKKDTKILLAQHKKHIQSLYTCIAGYMEAGETAEECVQREVFEETSLQIKNITYFATQSWPFPNQLMIGFTAEWKSGIIKIQEEELIEAKWFSPKDLPTIPPSGSLAYRLIKET